MDILAILSIVDSSLALVVAVVCLFLEFRIIKLLVDRKLV